MIHAIHSVCSVKIVGDYSLEIVFDDGFVRTIDFEPILHGEMYGPLRDKTIFDSVALDPEVHTITWSNGADFDPAILHDWEDYVEELVHRLQPR